MSHILYGQIEYIKYKSLLKNKLNEFNLVDNVNTWDNVCIIKYNDIKYAISKWISPKRTRSYPYARVYDTIGVCGKSITIIPMVKDEGLDGDRDYLQWDTISLMSLLNIYVIVAYYNDAEKSSKKNIKPNKITNQKFDSIYINQKLKDITSYHSSALHWNLEQMKTDNLEFIINKVIDCYNIIENNTKVKLHSIEGLEKFKREIMLDVENFKDFSRDKAQKAQNREVKTLQPKESINRNKKAKIELKNYLGGYYYFTIDELEINNNLYKLIECKHTKNKKLPSIGDIKDGLIKMIIYSNICEMKHKSLKVNILPILKITSNILINRITNNNNDYEINNFIKENKFTEKEIKFIFDIFEEAKQNNFEIIIEGNK